MTVFRLLRSTLIGSSCLMTAACAYGGQVSEGAAIARTVPAATQQSGGLLAIADDMAEKGQYEAAIPLYRHLANTTRNPEAITGLAASMLAVGDIAAAQAITDHQINHDGAATSSKTYYVHGKAALALGQFDTALAAFTEAHNRMPADTRVRSGRAIALAATGRGAEAVDAFGDSNDSSSLSNKALVLAAIGQTDAATDILEPIIASGSSNARDRQNLAMVYLLAGDEERAYHIARLDLDPASINETFRFYRSLSSLDSSTRMQALVTGTVKPEWTRAEAANLRLENTEARTLAAKRLVEEPALVVADAPAPEPEPVEEETVVAEVVNPEDYGLSEIPPIIEPEGWALQIGAYRSIKRLLEGWALLYARNVDLLADIPPRRSEVDFGEKEDGPKGFYYRLNAGPLSSFSEAKALCDTLIERGTSCWIRPPEASEGRLPEQAVLASNSDED